MTPQRRVCRKTARTTTRPAREVALHYHPSTGRFKVERRVAIKTLHGNGVAAAVQYVPREI